MEAGEMSVKVKRMAELLKSGATMLSEICPECGTPLFKIGEEIICPECNKPVVIIKATEEETKVLGERVLATVEQTILKKIQETETMIKDEKDPGKLIEFGNVLSSWLTALEKIRKLKSSCEQ
jgi:UPF0148 protein